MSDTRLITVPIIRDYRDAGFLLDSQVFSVDIETETSTDDEMWTGRDKFGLSHCAPISHISFYDGVNPAVVLAVPHPKPGSPECSDTGLWEFINAIFSREDYVAIAHNAVFDLRNLGATFGFLIPHSSQIWDTQVMAVRMTLADGFDETRGAPPDNHQPSKLEALVALFELVRDPIDLEFLKFMKDQRKVLSEMDTIIEQYGEKEDHILRRYAEYYGQTELDADWVIGQYVASDTIATYLLFEEEQRVGELVCYGKPQLHTINKTTQVFTWPELPELLQLEQRVSRMSCNQAIRGVALDVHYAMSNYESLIEQKEALTEEVHAVPDPTHLLPVEEWETTFFMLAWYRMVLEGVQKGANGRYNPMKKFNEDWPIKWTKDFNHKHLAAAMSGPNQEEWYNWLLSLTPDDSLNRIRKIRPKSDPPSLDLEKWVENFTEIDEENALVRWYKGWLKYNFYIRYVFLNENEDSKVAFSLYFIFTICNLPMPQDDDLKYLADLRTGSFTKVFPEYLTEDNLLIKALIAVHQDREIPSKRNSPETCRQRSIFSVSKKAIEFLIRRKFRLAEKEDLHEFDHPSAAFWRLAEVDAYLTGTIEFVKHSIRDDRIHSMMSRLTRTGRFSSQQPNIQNIKMSAYKGYLVGDPGFELLEFDYSNAENRMAASIAADNKFAMMTEGQDMHTEMAKIYKPAEAKALLAESYEEFKKKLRNPLKPVTFSIAYGGGPSKIAEILASDIHTARDLINRRKRAFPVTEDKKDDLKGKVSKQVSQGWYTPIVRIWDGSRVRVPVYGHGRSRQAKAHALWNYINQGSVAQMVARSMVLIDDYLYEHSFSSYIALNVHDSLITELADGEWPEVPIAICQIMNKILPESFLRRTTPRVHQVAEIGPENAKKWGWRQSGEYLFPLDEFINAWGVHKLEEGEDEAPTWLGPVDLGWTLDQETWDIARGIETDIGLPKEQVMVDFEKALQNAHDKPWEDLNPYESEYFSNILEIALALHEGLGELAKISEEASEKLLITIPTKEGSVSVKCDSLATRMAALWALAAAGKETGQYTRFREVIDRLLKEGDMIDDLSDNIRAFLGTYEEEW